MTKYLNIFQPRDNDTFLTDFFLGCCSRSQRNKKCKPWRFYEQIRGNNPQRCRTVAPLTSSSRGMKYLNASLLMVLIYFSRISHWTFVIIAFPVGLLSFASVKMRNGRIYIALNLISLRAKGFKFNFRSWYYEI